MPSGYLRATTSDRVVALVLALIALAVLIVASRLTPSGAGHGTHTQLGLPPCGMYLATGRPCPTCGMTTAFAALAEFHVWEAFTIQPFGALLGIATATFVWGALHVAVFGSRIGAVAMRMLTGKVAWTVLGLALAAWGYKLVTSPVGV